MKCVSIYLNILSTIILTWIVPLSEQAKRSFTLTSGFSQLAHDLSSGPVTFLDSRHVYIRNLTYDGTGPDAFFLVGKGEPGPQGVKIPDENGKLERLNQYTGQDVLLMLPQDLKWNDFDYLAVYCIQFDHLFGQLRIPNRAALNLPTFPIPPKIRG